MIPRAIPAATSRKGLMLAERRRAHLVELYKSGRWKRYFSEQEFLARMRDAVHDVELWSAATALWDEPDAAPAPQDIRIAEPPVIAVEDSLSSADSPVDVFPKAPAHADQVLGFSGSLS
jgi:uncharacterized repeat protein (TIGR03809 family)